MDIMRTTLKVCLQWEFTPESQCSTKLTMPICSWLLKPESNFTQNSLVADIHLESTIKCSARSSTLELWRTLVALHTTKPTCSEGKTKLSPRLLDSVTQISMSLDTCGLETLSPWNGGTIFGWMNLSPHSCHTWLKPSSLNLKSIMVLPGLSSQDIRDGLIELMDYHQLMLSVERYLLLMTPRLCSMVFHMEKDQPGLSNYIWSWVTTLWKLDFIDTSNFTHGKTLLYLTLWAA